MLTTRSQGRKRKVDSPTPPASEDPLPTNGDRDRDRDRDNNKTPPLPPEDLQPANTYNMAEALLTARVQELRGNPRLRQLLPAQASPSTTHQQPQTNIPLSTSSQLPETSLFSSSSSSQAPPKDSFEIYMENATITSLKIPNNLLFTPNMLNIPFINHPRSDGILEHDRLLHSLWTFLNIFPIDHPSHAQPYTAPLISYPNQQHGRFLLPLHEQSGLCVTGSEYMSSFLSLLKDLGPCISICKALSKILVSPQEVENAKSLLRSFTKENGSKHRRLPGVNDHNCFFVMRVSVNVDDAPSCVVNGCAFPFVAAVTLGTFTQGGEIRVTDVKGIEGWEAMGMVCNERPGDVSVFGVGVRFSGERWFGGDRYLLEFFLAG